MNDVGLVLAAGAGTRFGRPKAPVVVDDERLVDRRVRVLREGGCDDVVVIVGAWVGDVPEASVVVNERWELGMGTSLQTGLRHLIDSTYADRAVVSLVDLPGLTADVVREVRAQAPTLGVATYAGTPGHPVIISREHWKAIVDLPLRDEGARSYLASRDDVVLVEVGGLGSGDDMDVPQAAK